MLTELILSGRVVQMWPCPTLRPAGDSFTAPAPSAGPGTLGRPRKGRCVMRRSRRSFLAVTIAAALFAVSACSDGCQPAPAVAQRHQGRSLFVVDRPRREGGPRRDGRGLQGGTRASSSSTRPWPAAPAPTQVGARHPAAGQQPAGLVPGARRPRTAERHQGRQGRGPHHLYDQQGWKDKFPKGLHRRDHRRRQDLLGAGQHPPVQPAVVQPEDADRGRHHRRRRRPGRSS